MAGISRRYAREAYLAARGTVGGGLSAKELECGDFRFYQSAPISAKPSPTKSRVAHFIYSLDFNVSYKLVTLYRVSGFHLFFSHQFSLW